MNLPSTFDPTLNPGYKTVEQLAVLDSVHESICNKEEANIGVIVRLSRLRGNDCSAYSTSISLMLCIG